MTAPTEHWMLKNVVFSTPAWDKNRGFIAPSRGKSQCCQIFLKFGMYGLEVVMDANRSHCNEIYDVDHLDYNFKLKNFAINPIWQ